MPKTSDTIIGEQQSDVFKNRILLHTISIICDITDVSHKLNNNLFVISLEVDFIFSALHQFGYGSVCSFTWLKLILMISQYWI